MGLYDYLKDWGIPEQSGDQRRNASGADSSGGDYDGGVPERWDMPVSPEWGIGPDRNSGGFGHSDDCKDAGQKGSAWGLSTSEIGQGFERLASDGDGGVLETRQPHGSHPQSIPQGYSGPGYDRGAGSDSYAREHSATTGRGFDGKGQPESTSNPGGESLGSSKLPS